MRKERTKMVEIVRKSERYKEENWKGREEDKLDRERREICRRRRRRRTDRERCKPE